MMPRVTSKPRAAGTIRGLAAAIALFAAGVGAAMAQTPTAEPGAPLAGAQLTWQQCQGLVKSKTARLACFDRWAQQQSLPAAAVPPAPAALAEAKPEGELPKPVDAAVPATRVIQAGGSEGCRDSQYSELSRFWELEPDSSCGTFAFRGYRPINVSLTEATDAPDVPTSPSPGHTGTALGYQRQELRIGLSVRTKLAQGIFTRNDPAKLDSFWFGYSQQSTWQAFNGGLSRPFRATDHEPELMYVYPTDYALPGGWRWRFAGLGLVHQSNGQTLPLSRSWNRVYLMGGLELGNQFRVTAKVWHRLRESAAKDDNPDITDKIGRAEVAGFWNVDDKNTFGLTVRNNLHASGKGSARLEYLRRIGDSPKSNLRFHTQLFYGYGDTLIDYNRKRTVLSVGLSLVDF